VSTGKTIAFFDFDGTITTQDTMFVFFKYAKGTWMYYFYMMLLSPVFVLFKLKLLPGQIAKEISLIVLFKGIYKEELNRVGKEFCVFKIDGIIRPKAWEKILWHREHGHEVYIVSASAEEWLRPWTETKELNLICTSLRYDENGKFTGRIDGKNCNGKEKVCRIEEKINLKEYDTIYAYGDTSGDKDMLSIATFGEFRPFRD